MLIFCTLYAPDFSSAADALADVARRQSVKAEKLFIVDAVRI